MVAPPEGEVLPGAMSGGSHRGWLVLIAIAAVLAIAGRMAQSLTGLSAADGEGRVHAGRCSGRQ